MKKLHLLTLAVAAALAPAFAIAQTAAANAPRKLDANGDGAISKTEAAGFPRLAQKFDQLDKNRDGTLDAGERPALHRGMKRGHDGHGRMQALDADKDGRISKAEAQAGKAGFASRFEQMDTNHDGYLDRGDMALRMQQQRAAFFSGADADRDGKLSRDEFTVEQGARSAERREKFAQRLQARGKQAPTDAERLQRAGQAFDHIDANKDGVVTRAEFDAFKPMGGQRRGMGQRQPQG